MLTGRYPSRSIYAAQASLLEASDQFGVGEAGMYGTNVSILNSKLAFEDTIYNVPYVLQNDEDNPYFTGMIGKWHLMAPELYLDADTVGGIDCSDLMKEPILSEYEECADVVRQQGFDVVDAFYFGNIMSDLYSHNPEWMISRSQRFMEEAERQNKPFYLYLATTLMHVPGTRQTLKEWTLRNSSKGLLSGDEVPDDTTMRAREEIRQAAIEMSGGAISKNTEEYAQYLWLDDQFGALIDYLKSNDLYDNTAIFFVNDHGRPTKGMLYEQGSRIVQFVRYPPLFGYDQHVLDNFVVSNVDIAASIFDLAEITPPDEYVLDGTSFIEDALFTIDHQDTIDSMEQLLSASYTHESTCCQYRFVEVLNSRAIYSEHHLYLFRMEDTVDTEATDGELWYPHTYDMEQFYDLGTDPNCKVNLIADEEHIETITMFQRMMREHLEDTCIAQGDVECVVPGLTTRTPAPTHPGKAVVRGGSSISECRSDNQCDEGLVCSRGICDGPAMSGGKGGESSSRASSGGNSGGGGRGSGGGGRGGNDQETEELESVVIGHGDGVQHRMKDMTSYSTACVLAGLAVLALLSHFCCDRGSINKDIGPLRAPRVTTYGTNGV